MSRSVSRPMDAHDGRPTDATPLPSLIREIVGDGECRKWRSAIDAQA